MFLMKDNQITPAQVKVSASPSYTLAELNELAKQWANENEATNDARWIVSGLLAWLGKKEREGNDATGGLS